MARHSELSFLHRCPSFACLPAPALPLGGLLFHRSAAFALARFPPASLLRRALLVAFPSMDHPSLPFMVTEEREERNKGND